jgi:DNA-binding Lrp family transcriptional regulator
VPCAYVLFNVDSGSEDRVLEELRGIAEVQKAFFSYGVYDLIVTVKTDSMEKLKEIVSHRLRSITSVKSTITLIQVEERKIIVTI